MIALWMAYSTAVAATLGLAAALLERATAGRVRHRRWIWLGALVGSALLPGWTTVVPDDVRPAASSEPVVSSTNGPSVSSGSNALATRLAGLVKSADARALAQFDSSLAIAWLAAALMAAVVYGVASWSLRARRRTWHSAKIDGEHVLLSPTVGPAVIGALRPRIVVPEWAVALPSAQRTLILEHERQHIRARDPLMLHGAALLLLLMPWNVAAWWLTRRLRLAVELDCDARVLAGGRDVRDYGMLLLDVCSRRMRDGLVLSAALLERNSSLTRRILAMHPDRSRFQRTRIALGIGAAVVAAAVACEMPSPEMLAPDGKDEASARVFGRLAAAAGTEGVDDLRQTVARHFPEVARGEGGPTILYVVKAPGAGVVLTEMQPADEFVRMPASAEKPVTGEQYARAPLQAYAREVDGQARQVAESEEGQRPGGLRMKTRVRGDAFSVPAGIGALRPDDIESIDVSKHAAGSLAPKPVSVILIMLKPNAMVPLRVTR